MNTVEKLDAIAEYQAQIDYLEMKKRELIDAVKIPEEVQTLHNQGQARKRAINADGQKELIALELEKRERLASVVVPPEILAAFQAVEEKRHAIEEEFENKKQFSSRETFRRLEAVDAEFEGSIKNVYAQVEQRKQEINAEFAGKAEAAQENIDKLTAEIKDEVAREGKSIKGAHYQAVYTRGRVSWDSAKLDGLMILLPQLKEARKEGAPSVSIRRID